MQNTFSNAGKLATRYQATVISLLLCLGTTAIHAQTLEQLAQQRADYNAVRAKSIVELQPFRQETVVTDPESGEPVRFISLNPAINSWFLLQIGADGSRNQKSYHLENADPSNHSLSLVAGVSPALIINEKRCELWTGDPSPLSKAHKSGLPYAPLCDGKLYLRNKVSGSRTTLERTAEFLRENVWKGDSIVQFVKNNFFKDSELELSTVIGSAGTDQTKVGPTSALITTSNGKLPIITALHGLGLTGTKPGQMTVGLWYPVAGLDGVFASAIQPNKISDKILKGPGTTNALDYIESRATDYMVAFDLVRYDIGYAVGTHHPALRWSPRPPYSVRRKGLRGPDGVSSAKPLVTLGMVSPALTERTIATFTAGFKREHGAFRYGDYAFINYGTHYGFIQNGVILSKLQPNLATLYALKDGTINMKTWQVEDNTLLPQIRFARQNGVPLIAPDPETGLSIPGDRVKHWGAGNWSGSAEASLRTLRAGACMIQTKNTRYLVYGYFSTATPSVMARSFQAYGCTYAMLLDMNSLVHTYLALYIQRDGKIHIEHLIPGMRTVDKKTRDGNLIPRFIGFPDNRDLFYIMRREEKQ